MAVDMTLVPWSRLAKLAPPGTNGEELQAAADRYALTGDLYAACADLWEEAAMAIDTTPDDVPTTPTEDRAVKSVSQDGISITYADEALIGDNMSSRLASQAAFMAKARYFRSRAKASTPLMHRTDYEPFRGRGVHEVDPDLIIPVNEVTEL